MAAPQPAAESGRFERFAAWQIRRYGNAAVSPLAALLAVFGVGLAATPGSYASPLYTFTFAVLPGRVTGLIFLTVGAAALTRPNRVAVAALVGAHVGWGLAVLYASVFVAGVSPTAWAYPLFTAGTVFMSVAGRSPAALRRPRTSRR